MRHLKNRITINAIVFFLTISLLNAGVAVGAGSDRVYPTDKVTIYNGDKKVGVYTKEALFPKGGTLLTSGICLVKLVDFFLVGKNNRFRFEIGTFDQAEIRICRDEAAEIILGAEEIRLQHRADVRMSSRPQPFVDPQRVIDSRRLFHHHMTFPKYV